ncbi:hypothetical protein VFPPC_15771 [Pochonia chlamydosporia 170]|uniref:Uncharacterized protein n=1 Tax=Pochonia chlamydosporia 170 TaxID=1380566 RepID=A0A179FQZ4_METCM|nr:hypothetical protein VFPPC_15771 [Pochonia chlamydosporia 170]OAQ68046.1 hypothetical protein VFPPC_15771 [Pochonia chlamydosporia 170]
MKDVDGDAVSVSVAGIADSGLVRYLEAGSAAGRNKPWRACALDGRECGHIIRGVQRHAGF